MANIKILTEIQTLHNDWCRENGHPVRWEELQAASRKLQAASSKRQAQSGKLQASSRKLQAL
jgi:hypothetical protein